MVTAIDFDLTELGTISEVMTQANGPQMAADASRDVS